MKPLAARTDALRQSDIRAVTFEVNRVGGINLGQGICDLATPTPIVEATVAALRDGSQIYTAYNGTQALREAIAANALSFNGIPVESLQRQRQCLPLPCGGQLQSARLPHGCSVPCTPLWA